MSAACPSCRAGLAPRELKPGKYQPRCLKCGVTFILEVQWKVSSTPAKSVVHESQPSVSRHAPSRPAAPALHKIESEELAARMLAGEDVSQMTGAFTDADPGATGDFTEPDSRSVSKPCTPSRHAKDDPSTTGDFTEPAASNESATGDFTEADAGAGVRRAVDHTDPMATGDFSENMEPAPRKSVLKTSKASQAEAEVDEPLDDDTPPRLGGYEVLKVLGKGGMGSVLLGRQLSLDRRVALKVMHPKIAENPTFVARFTREAFAAAQLAHHNVIQIFDIGEDRGQHFFSMEFVAGQSLMEMVKKEGKLAPEVAVGYILQAARGLKYGHLQGMVHRDIKPDNLMLNTEGLVKVADLGLVKVGNAELGAKSELPSEDDFETGDPQLTRAGAVMGTPAYMSPEQATDSGTVDQRADIYSLGCTLYVLITGKPPFEGKTAMEIITKHKMEAIVPPEVVVKRVPRKLSTILLKMMAKKPEERFQSMDEVIAAFEVYLGIDRSGPFNPAEEQADQLEKVVHQFNYRSRSKAKRNLAVGFFALCLTGIVGSALAGMPAIAGGLAGLMFMAPMAYFVVHGMLTGGVVFPRCRELVFGMRFFDWLMWIAGGALFLVTLFLFGMLWHWLAFAVLAVGLGFLLWFLTDRKQTKAQDEPLVEARALFKTMRLQGLEEDALRQFICKYSGSNWEPFYEALFGYEAKLAARSFRKGDTGEVAKKASTWREPVLNMLEARLESRQQARERRHLQKVEARALEAGGMSKAEARTQADAMAAGLVEQASAVKQAKRYGKVVNVSSMVAAAQANRRPKPGYNIAGVKQQSLWMKDFLNDWLGRRLRFVLGAAIFAIGLLWMHQNNLLKKNKTIAAVQQGNLEAAQQQAKQDGEAVAKATTKPLTLPFVPTEFTEPINSYAVPITGFLLMLSGILYFGWRPSLAAIPGAAIGVLGPRFGMPEVAPLSASQLSLIIGSVLIVVVARLLRK